MQQEASTHTETRHPKRDTSWSGVFASACACLLQVRCRTTHLSTSLPWLLLYLCVAMPAGAAVKASHQWDDA